MSGSFILEAAAEAAAEAKAESLLMVLEGRFDDVPETVRSTIAGLTDIPRLDALTKAVAKAESLEEFVRSL